MAEWEDELERWLKPFLDRLGHKTWQRMYVAGLIGPGDRKAFSRWLSALPRATTTSCTISLRTVSGTRAAGDRAAQPGGPTCRRQGCGAGC